MPPDALSLDLRSLKLFGVAQAAEDLATQGAPAYQAAVAILEILVKAESSEREVRSINYQLRSARFPSFQDLVSFVLMRASSRRPWCANCIGETS